MYYYVYDEFTQDKRYEREMALIETRLTDLGIQGKVARLALFRDPAEMIRDEVRKGAKTVVAVGNDVTLRKVIDAVASLGTTLGIIPLGKTDNHIAEMIGMPMGAAACDVLSARIIEEMDLGVINNGRFLHRVQMEAPAGVQIICDNNFTLYVPRQSQIAVRNLAVAEDGFPLAHPADGYLELAIKSPVKSWLGKKDWQNSFLKFREIKIVCEREMEADVDGQEFINSEFRVSCIPKQIRMITGRARQFISE